MRATRADSGVENIRWVGIARRSIHTGWRLAYSLGFRTGYKAAPTKDFDLRVTVLEAVLVAA